MASNRPSFQAKMLEVLSLCASVLGLAPVRSEGDAQGIIGLITKYFPLRGREPGAPVACKAELYVPTCHCTLAAHCGHAH
jgi:hypothetical protein